MEVPNKIKLPDIDSEEKKEIPENKKIFINPIYHKEYLSHKDILDCINHLSAVLLADECYSSQKKHKRYL